jgi:mitogen-activated protein kinase kinase kinase
MGGATTMKGSVFWMAPEVVFSSHERGYSGKVDIWSLGCVVLEMWTGKRPWGEVEQVAALFEVGHVTPVHIILILYPPMTCFTHG